MALVLDRCQFTTATTGTGTITVGSATSGYQTPAGAGAVNGALYSYFIVDGTAWEVGTGTYTSAGTTLSRTLIASSTASLLNLSGSATVTIAPNTADFNPPHPGYVSGNWYSAQRTQGGTLVLTANTLYAVPVYIAGPVTLQALGIRVTAGVASTNAKLGLYSNSSARPGTLLATTTSVFSTAAIATVTQALTANYTVPSPGFYWLAMISDGAATVQAINNNDQFIQSVIGGSTALQVTTTSSTPSGVTGTGATYVGGLPSTFGAATLVTAVASPLFAFQVA